MKSGQGITLTAVAHALVASLLLIFGMAAAEAADTTVTINPNPGNGTVTSSPAGINCGSGQTACSFTFPGAFSLQATPGSGYAFVRWDISRLIFGTYTETANPLPFSTAITITSYAIAATFSLPGTAPAFTSANAATFRIGTPGNFTVTATGSPTPTVSRGGVLPSGITFTAAEGTGTGTLSGTPTFGTNAAGTYSAISFTASNGVAPDATQGFQLTVERADQTIAFGSLANKTLGDPPFAVSATASSGLTASFASSTTTVCTVAGNTVTLVSAGTCTINASQPGDADYSAAPDVSRSFTVAAPSGNTLTVTFAGTGSGTVTSLPPGISCAATCAANFPPATAVVLTANAAAGSLFGGWSGSGCVGTGTCNVTMDAAKGVTATFNQLNAITSANAATFTVKSAGTFTVTATGNPAPTLSVAGALPAGVTFNPATGVIAGTPASGTVNAYPLTITASNGGVAPNATQNFTLTVAKAAQTIAFAFLGNRMQGESPFTVTATASSGLTVSFVSTTLAVCTVSGNTVTLVTAGTCTISARQAGNADYNAAPSIDRSFAVAGIGSVPVNVTFSGTGAGTVTSSPPGINCTTACAFNFATGNTVTLTATAAAGSLFAGWSGACTGTAPCVLPPLSATTQVNAKFDPAPTALGVSSTSLSFGGQSMNTTSPAQTLTLTNPAVSQVAVNSITAPASYAVSHNCATIAAGATCTASVTFTPTSEGALDGTLTIASALGTQTVALSGTGERSLVTHYYRSILRRAPDSGGKAFWDAEAARVQAIGVNVNEVWFAMAQSFYTSAEYVALGRDNTGFITDLFITFFNRTPDQAGLDYWVGQLNQGMPREVVLTAYLFSTEFSNFAQTIFGSKQVRREIDTVVDFYRGFLSRLADDGGFSYWLGQFRSAQCQAASQGSGAPVFAAAEGISSAYSNSPEYANRGRSNSQYVGDLYNAFLRRGGDLEGVQYWINQLDTGARTRENVRQAFLGSPEFNARVLAVIAQGCVLGQDYDVASRLIPSPTGPAGATMCNFPTQPPSPGSGPGMCGSYQIPVGTCSSGMTGENAINVAFQYNLEDMVPGSLRLGNSMRLTIPRDAAMVFRFKTGPASAYPELLNAPFVRFLTLSYEEQVSRGPAAPHFVTISETRCDFDYGKTLTATPPALNGCYVPMAIGGGVLMKIWPLDKMPLPGADYPYCPLKPDTYYYVNIRYEDASTVAGRGILNCNPGSTASGCGAAIGFN